MYANDERVKKRAGEKRVETGNAHDILLLGLNLVVENNIRHRERIENKIYHCCYCCHIHVNRQLKQVRTSKENNTTQHNIKQ